MARNTWSRYTIRMVGEFAGYLHQDPFFSSVKRSDFEDSGILCRGFRTSRGSQLKHTASLSSALATVRTCYSRQCTGD